MVFQERLVWVNLVVTVLVTTWYVRLIAGRLGDVAASDVAYVGPLVGATVAIVVLSVVGAISLAIAAAIAVEVTGEGSTDDLDRKDERDRHIAQRGDVAVAYVSSVVLVMAFVLAVLELPYFWIANAIFAGLVVAGLASSGVKLVAYRRGF